MARPGSTVLPDHPREGSGVEVLPTGPWAAARLYFAQRLKVRLAYRVDFAINALGEVFLAGVGILFLTTLFQHVNTLESWTAAEVTFCWGFAETVVGLFFMGFNGLYSLNQRYILGGELDRALLRPADPYLQVLLDNLSFEDVPIALLGLFVMGWASLDMAPIPAWKLALMPLYLASATAVLGGLLTAISSIGFHLHHRGTAVGLVFQLSTFTRYPIDLFARPLRWLLTFVLPLAFSGFYPAVFFMDRPEWMPYAIAQPFVGAACMGLGYLGWRVGLERYTSSGN